MEVNKFENSFLDEIIEIEKKSFECPWTEKMFLSSAESNTSQFMVFIQNGTVVGYYITNTAVDEIEILKIAVRPEFRRLKIGKTMMLRIKEEAVNVGIKFIFLEVCKTNIVALNLYECFGFEEVGVRKKYYKTKDALILRLTN